MKEKAYKLLDDLNIGYEKLTHPPLFTCEDALKYRVEFAGLDVKNLFVRNKDKSQFYLVIIPFDKRANLAELATKLNETKMSFASEQYLLDMLKTTSGSCSLLNVANVDKVEYIVVLDEELFKHEKIGFHPSDNTETVVFGTNAIEKILKQVNASFKIIKI